MLGKPQRCSGPNIRGTSALAASRPRSCAQGRSRVLFLPLWATSSDDDQLARRRLLACSRVHNGPRLPVPPTPSWIVPRPRCKASPAKPQVCRGLQRLEDPESCDALAYSKKNKRMSNISRIRGFQGKRDTCISTCTFPTAGPDFGRAGGLVYPYQ